MTEKEEATSDVEEEEEEVEEKKTKAKGKKVAGKKRKADSGPKRPKTAYFCFNDVNRAEVKAKYPGLKPPEIIKKLSEMWNGLSEKEKKPYYERQAEERKKYEEECARLGHPIKKQKKDAKDKPPKKPRNAYNFFAEDTRKQMKEEGDERKFGEMNKEISSRWKEVSESDKKPFEERAATDKTRYEGELESYKKEHPDYDEKRKKKGDGKKKGKAKKGKGKKKKEESDEEEEADDD